MIRSLITLAMTLGVCLGNAACARLPVSTEGPLPAAVRSHPESFIVITVRNDTAPMVPRAGSTMRGYDGTARYTVGNNARAAVDALAAAHRLREVSSWPIAALGIHCVVFELPANETAAQMLERLRHDSRVETAQPLNAFATRSTPRATPRATYNDPYQGLQSSLVSMNVLPAHRWSRGAGVRVAVIDTGVDTAHPDLAGRIAERRNFVDDDDWTFNHDRHGTAVAGVIAADSNNRIGIVGVAPEARLHVYKACWQLAGAHEAAACNTFTLAKALAAAIDARVQIANLSLSGPEDSLLTRLVARGQQQGIIFVSAASAATDPPSNARSQTTSQNKSQSGFPGGINGVITVAAIERHRTESGVLLAPGVEVLTLVPEGHYDFISGSSLAAANVSGTIALLKARDRTLRIGQLKQLLTTTARSVATGDITETVVDACAALGALLKQDSCPQSEAASVAAE